MKSLILLITGSLLALAVAETPSKPNVIFILTDDMGPGDLATLGGKQGPTPNLDRLASEGTRFTQFYVAAPICSASRAAFTTGMFPGRVGINSFLQTRAGNQRCEQRDWLDPKWPTLARTLKQSGYATAHFGKWHLGGGYGVTDAPTPAAYGYDEFHLNCEGVGPQFDHYGDGKSTTLNTGDGKRYPRHQFTEYWVDRSLAFIKQHQAGPFYLELWPQDVHTPHTPSEAALARSKAERIPERQHLFQAVLNEYDRQIGRLLDGLRELGVEQNTIVVFSADNGPEPSFDHTRTLAQRGMKWSLYEGGIHEPFIVRWPGKVPAGEINDRTVLSSVDYFATVCGLVGVKQPSEAAMDGADMTSIILGSHDLRRKPLFWEYGRKPRTERQHTGYPYPQKQDQSPNVAVRDGDWKLLLNADGSDPQLYDLKSDPKETSNVAAAQPTITTRLTKLALDWRLSLP